MLIGEYVQQFEPGINDANNIANSALVQSREALDQAKNATAIANEALGQSRASVIELINSVNASTVTLIGNKNDGSQTTTNLPVASELQAGVMNTATYVNLKDLNSRVTSLESNTTTYIVVLPNDTPTQAEILNAYRTAYPLAPNPPLDGTTVIDVDKQLFYRYVKNGDIWIKTSGFNVTPFTNENAGIIKGSTTPGQVQAETDGTGSLVGYDQIKSDITANAAGIQTLTTSLGTTNSNVTALTTRVNTNTSNIANAVNTINTVGTGIGASINYVKMGGTQASTALPVVSTSQAGIVTPAMFNQWNSGGEKLSLVTYSEQSNAITFKIEALTPLSDNFLSVGVFQFAYENTIYRLSLLPENSIYPNSRQTPIFWLAMLNNSNIISNEQPSAFKLQEIFYNGSTIKPGKIEIICPIIFNIEPVSIYTYQQENKMAGARVVQILYNSKYYRITRI